MSLAPFSSVVDRHGPMVWRVCRSVVGPVDADDAWSDTFLAALRAYPDLDPGANVAAWLTTIAQRKAIDLVRKRSRAPVPVGAAPPERAGATHTGPVEDGLADAFPGDDELAVAVRSLSERQRTIVLQHHVAGVPYGEIARMWGISPEAARRSAADGIARLRAIYGKDRT